MNTLSDTYKTYFKVLSSEKNENMPSILPRIRKETQERSNHILKKKDMNQRKLGPGLYHVPSIFDAYERGYTLSTHKLNESKVQRYQSEMEIKDSASYNPRSKYFKGIKNTASKNLSNPYTSTSLDYSLYHNSNSNMYYPPTNKDLPLTGVVKGLFSKEPKNNTFLYGKNLYEQSQMPGPGTYEIPSIFKRNKDQTGNFKSTALERFNPYIF